MSLPERFLQWSVKQKINSGTSCICAEKTQVLKGLLTFHIKNVKCESPPVIEKKKKCEMQRLIPEMIRKKTYLKNTNYLKN